MTGTVIDSGDGVTHIVPVVSGYVIGSCIKHIPLAGRTITDFIAEQLRNRGEPVPPDQILDVSRRIKEMHCYVCPDLVKEYGKYDAQPDKHFVTYEGADTKTKKPFTVDIGYERFLGPELFFNPEIFSSDFSTPLPDLIDQVVQACPIDTRKKLYSYITLSGGSTMYKNFTRRIERDLTKKVKERHDKNIAAFPDMDLKMLDVNVITHPFQRFAVWFGGSMLAAQPDVIKSFHTRYAACHDSIAHNIYKLRSYFTVILPQVSHLYAHNTFSYVLLFFVLFVVQCGLPRARSPHRPHQPRLPVPLSAPSTRASLGASCAASSA